MLIQYVYTYSHINTKSKVTGHKGAEELEAAIKDSDVGKYNILCVCVGQSETCYKHKHLCI